LVHKLIPEIPRVFLTTLDAIATLIHLTVVQRVLGFPKGPKGLFLRLDFSLASRMALAPIVISCLFLATVSTWWSVICLVVSAIAYMIIGIGLWFSTAWASAGQACLGLLSLFMLASPSTKRLLRLQENTLLVRLLFPVFSIIYLLITLACLKTIFDPRQLFFR